MKSIVETYHIHHYDAQGREDVGSGHSGALEALTERAREIAQRLGHPVAIRDKICTVIAVVHPTAGVKVFAQPHACGACGAVADPTLSELNGEPLCAACVDSENHDFHPDNEPDDSQWPADEDEA